MGAPRHSDDFGALLAAGMRGLGGGLSGASAARDRNERRREAFRARLRESLVVAGVDLAAATLGRGVGNAPFWDVTMQWPAGGVSSTRVLLAASTEPYSEQALQAVIESVTSSLASGRD